MNFTKIQAINITQSFKKKLYKKGCGQYTILIHLSKSVFLGETMVRDFPRTLSLLRQEKRISQRKAAAELGVSQALLSHYENGVREPGLTFVVRAADYYGVSVDYLLGRTMARDGGAILAADVPDSSEGKDNILRGNAAALLNKKLLVNSTALLFELLGKESAQLTAMISSYLSTAFYKAFRMVYALDRSSSSEVFPVEESCYSELCDAELKRSEGALRRLASQKGSAISSDLSQEALQGTYPHLTPSLFSLLHAVSTRLEKEGEK